MWSCSAKKCLGKRQKWSHHMTSRIWDIKASIVGITWCSFGSCTLGDGCGPHRKVSRHNLLSFNKDTLDYLPLFELFGVGGRATGYVGVMQEAWNTIGAKTITLHNFIVLNRFPQLHNKHCIAGLVSNNFLFPRFLLALLQSIPCGYWITSHNCFSKWISGYVIYVVITEFVSNQACNNFGRNGAITSYTTPQS